MIHPFFVPKNLFQSMPAVIPVDAWRLAFEQAKAVGMAGFANRISFV